MNVAPRNELQIALRNPDTPAPNSQFLVHYRDSNDVNQEIYKLDTMLRYLAGGFTYGDARRISGLVNQVLNSFYKLAEYLENHTDVIYCLDVRLGNLIKLLVSIDPIYLNSSLNPNRQDFDRLRMKLIYLSEECDLNIINEFSKAISHLLDENDDFKQAMNYAKLRIQNVCIARESLGRSRRLGFRGLLRRRKLRDRQKLFDKMLNPDYSHDTPNGITKSFKELAAREMRHVSTDFSREMYRDFRRFLPEYPYRSPEKIERLISTGKVTRSDIEVERTLNHENFSRDNEITCLDIVVTDKSQLEIPVDLDIVRSELPNLATISVQLPLDTLDLSSQDSQEKIENCFRALFISIQSRDSVVNVSLSYKRSAAHTFQGPTTEIRQKRFRFWTASEQSNRRFQRAKFESADEFNTNYLAMIKRIAEECNMNLPKIVIRDFKDRANSITYNDDADNPPRLTIEINRA